MIHLINLDVLRNRRGISYIYKILSDLSTKISELEGKINMIKTNYYAATINGKLMTRKEVGGKSKLPAIFSKETLQKHIDKYSMPVEVTMKKLSLKEIKCGEEKEEYQIAAHDLHVSDGIPWVTSNMGASAYKHCYYSNGKQVYENKDTSEHDEYKNRDHYYDLILEEDK